MMLLKCCQKAPLGPEKMAQDVKCLPGEHEDMNLVPRTNTENHSTVGNACDPSTGEEETGGSLMITNSQSGRRQGLGFREVKAGPWEGLPRGRADICHHSCGDRVGSCD